MELENAENKIIKKQCKKYKKMGEKCILPFFILICI